MTVVVVGVGNEYRRDDGVGPVVARAIQRMHPSGVRVEIVEGEASALLDTWVGADLAVIVDAVACTPASPGEIHRFVDHPIPSCAEHTSSHGLGITEALALAAALGREPLRLVIYAVEAGDTDIGVGLSPELAAAVPVVTAMVAAEIARFSPPGDESRWTGNGGGHP
ncbi:hydrogenase maturation protease [Rhodococcus sp. UNC363MFTsu5.1]|uniref:hydrogenase maturation protease n=1 Tax=Rhodococcus sp. UNC363MFTsu5.1 TaxID=1449069 RepID=UPI0009E0B2C8|nr:hydrogenase maturation protease [Rhodococcus sp. UNC363MFTsu5.1]